MDTLARLRRLVQAIVAAGLLGTALDLVLLAHYEDVAQFIPFFVVALALVSILWMMASPGLASALAARAAMMALIGSGLAGMALHYRGSMEFKLELDPSLSGLALFRQVIVSQAPPLLAPSTLVLFGLLGLASTYRMEDRHDD